MNKNVSSVDIERLRYDTSASTKKDTFPGGGTVYLRPEEVVVELPVEESSEGTI